MSQRGTVYYGRHLLTMTPGQHAGLADGAVYVVDGEVVAIGTSPDLRRRYPEALWVGGSDRVLIPGLIDAHQHGRAITSSGHGIDDEPLECWLLAQRTTPTVDVGLSTQIAGIRLLLSGITTAAHLHLSRPGTKYGADIVDAVRGYQESGLRIRFGVDVRDRANFTYEDDDTFLARLPSALATAVREELLGPPPPSRDEVETSLAEAHRVADGSRVHVGIAARGPQWCTASTLDWLADLTARGWHFQTHCSETRAQYAHFARSGSSPVRTLHAHRLLSRTATLAHCVWLDPEDVEILAQTATVVAHNPASNIRLESGVAPTAVLRSQGVPVALGSDSIGISNDRPDLFAAARLSRQLERTLHVTQDRSSIMDGLVSFLQAGRRAVALHDGVGQISVGGPADLVMLDWDTLTFGMLPEAAEDSVAETVASRAEATAVRDVIVDGRHLVQDGRYVRADLAELEKQLYSGVETSGRPVSQRTSVAELKPLVRADVDQLSAAVPTTAFVR